MTRSTKDPRPVDREMLIERAARMFYNEDRTQAQIGTELGLNRWQVSRLLQEGRDLGIVRIEIVPRSDHLPELETRLVETYGLRDAVVVRRNGAGRLEGVARAAGQYLAALKPRPRRIGVSWGRTMAAVAHWLPEGWASDIEVVQINGTVAPVPQSGHHNDVAETFARKGGGRFVPLPVPAIVGAAETRVVLERDRIVSDVLRLARSTRVLCFSLGAVEGSALLVSGNITEAEQSGLRAAGAVGDVLGRFIDARGAIADSKVDERTIGLSLADLKTRDHAICVVTGPDKHNVTCGALRVGLCNVLITDEDTAIHALEHAYDR
ncbi:deoxyribonucleoside regulator [Palleronia aestuarii]|uniref:Deoxyribonucleoside regulator n=1 Tax=Palleronia aestuarii TaxID=568105 RepID=A0A2W7N1G6_9RHOB|nr:sugar-binding transcriptional regulator [Palleronia aestuarii]PZX12197.1 deoxyribonucleoside regulator [Palleronia aestuarii]